MVRAIANGAALDRWNRLDGLVQRWLRERQALLLMLGGIQGIRGLERPAEPAQIRLQRFCELLMDYISAGYFEIYRELALAGNQTRQQTAMTRSILSRLEDSTDEALAFNQDFDTPEHCRGLYPTLRARLSRLLEKLEERFALEDQLIVSIHQDDSATGTSTLH